MNGKSLVFWKGIYDREVPAGAGQVILYNCTGVEVTGQAIYNATVGVQVISSTYCRIADNTCSHNTNAGIILYDTDETAIIGNMCNGNIMKSSYYYGHMYSSGIVLEDSKSNTLVNNKCDENGNSGIWCNEFTHNTFVNNSCCENGKDGMYIGNDISHYNYEKEISSVRDNKCCSNGHDGIHILEQTAHLSGNNCSQNMVNGISLNRVSYFEVLRNSCDGNNGSGIHLRDAYDWGSIHLIEKNRCRFNNGSGIGINDSSDVRIINNSCLDNIMNGIYLNRRSDDSHVLSNNCSRNERNGIGLDGPCCDISNNSVGQNVLSGIFLGHTCESRIAFNDLTENGRYGIEAGPNSSENSIFRNHFLRNDVHPSQGFDEGRNNIWSRNGTGNHWSDRTGPDDDWDHIVDLPYRVDGSLGNVDPFPIATNTTARADAGRDITVSGGDTVRLRPADTFRYRKRLNYTWSFVYENQERILYGPEVSFKFERPGRYRINLTVTDENGTYSKDTMNVTVDRSKRPLVIIFLAVAVFVVVLVIVGGRIKQLKKQHRTYVEREKKREIDRERTGGREGREGEEMEKTTVKMSGSLTKRN